MIEVKEVLTGRQRRDFLEFPNRLYKGNPYYVAPLYIDEIKIFRKDYVYMDTCEAVYYLAYKDGKVAGRISGILQKASNKKWGQKRVRFTRFDVIEDFEVAGALFAAVEKWALDKGMDTVCGPLGFSDLEREGLLVEGFDQMSTFEEAYNAPYYQEFIEKLGFVKETEWTESQIRLPENEEEIEIMRKTSEFIMKRYNLKFGTAPNIKKFLEKYAEGFFDILDRSYENVYGTVPFTDAMKKLVYSNFQLICDTKHLAVIVDAQGRAVCMGICFPSLAHAMQASGGHLTPRAIWRYLKAIRHPDVIDMGLIGVDPEYLNRGLSGCIAYELVKMLQQPGVKYAETNLNLVDNYAIQNMWKRFDQKQNKRRYAYSKKIG